MDTTGCMLFNAAGKQHTNPKQTLTNDSSD